MSRLKLSSATILRSPQATQAVLFFISGLAFFLRVSTLARQSLWRDEVDAIRFSGWALKDLVAGLTQPGHNGPLFFFLLRYWRNLAGSSEFALRYPSAVMGVLAVPLGFILARQFGFSRRTGLLTGLLLATSPYLIWYGQEAKMYTLLVALVTLAFIAYMKALSGGKSGWWVVFTLATSFSFYIHILSPLMLLVYGLIAWLYRARLRRAGWRAWLLSMACLTLPYLPLVLWQLAYLVDGADRGHPFYSLQRQLYLQLKLYSGGLFQLVGPSGAILSVFLLLCGLFLFNRRAYVEGLNWTRRGSLAAWLLLPPLAAFLISLRIPVFEDRYLIYITPAFYLLVALGLVLIRQQARWLAGLGLGLLLAINLMGIWQQQREPVKADFRAAAAYLSSQPRQPEVIMIQMPYLKHTFNYYYPHKYIFLEGLWTNDGKTEATVDAEMSRLTAELTDLWLVVSEGETWDRRRLVRGWLDSQAHLVDEAHFRGVAVYYYQLRPGIIETPDLVSE